MFRFEHSEYLYALALIPLLVMFYAASQIYRRRAVQRLGSTHLLDRMMPDRSKRKDGLKFALTLLALAFLVVAWANPQWGSKREKVTRKGIDLFIALDISQSMMAEDISPNRLLRARRFAQNLTNELRGENIGVILFACNAYVQVPLTTDYAFAELFLATASPDLAASQGTAIAEAIQLAERSFSEDNKNHKALIIISDGEDHEGTAASAASTARDNGLLTFTVGVGTPQGAFIPVSLGLGQEDYKRDPATGSPVRSMLDEAALANIAKAGSGNYFNLSAGADAIIPALKQRIDSIEKREFEQRSFSEYESYFQHFLALGLLLLLIEFGLSYRKSRLLGSKDFFREA